jgi:hypothetical protein
VEIPARIEQAVSDAVAQHLETELGDRGLLLAADGLAAAEAEAAQRGARLLTCAIHRCYPISRQGGRALAFEFESERDAARLGAALAFGAVTARMLGPGKRDLEQFADSVELLCAMFNLGIGLVDGVCDEDAETGGALLELVQGHDLAKAAEEPRARGWLRATLPPALADDHTVAFTVEIIETFFATLHAVYPNDAWLQQRRGVGTQLGSALEAERQSVIGSVNHTTREQLIECSRLTSVIPFQIIEALAGGDHAPTERTAGTLLGEAMWRIDDLVDLCQDARRGALNGVLLAAAEEPGHPVGECDLVAVLESLLASTDIACAAALAAESLLAGLQLADGGRATAQDHLHSLSFLHFIQRYAGIAPRSDVMTQPRLPTPPQASPPATRHPRPGAR